jgi:hypothetical protein
MLTLLLPNFGWHCFFLSADADSLASNWLANFVSFYCLILFLPISICLCPDHLYSCLLASFLSIADFLLSYRLPLSLHISKIPFFLLAVSLSIKVVTFFLPRGYFVFFLCSDCLSFCWIALCLHIRCISFFPYPDFLFLRSNYMTIFLFSSWLSIFRQIRQSCPCQETWLLSPVYEEGYLTVCPSIHAENCGHEITINVPLFKKLRDIIFFVGQYCNFMSHFEGHFEGAKTFLTP